MPDGGVLLGVLLLGALVGAALVLRARTLLTRTGAFECAYRPPGRRAWVGGVAVFGSERLEWYRLVSLNPRPSRSWPRTALVRVEQRSLQVPHGGPEVRTGVPDVRGGVPEVRTGVPEVRSGAPEEHGAPALMAAALVAPTGRRPGSGGLVRRAVVTEPAVVEVACECRDRAFGLAMSRGCAAGFVSWLEAAPPGWRTWPG